MSALILILICVLFSSHVLAADGELNHQSHPPKAQSTDNSTLVPTYQGSIDKNGADEDYSRLVTYECGNGLAMQIHYLATGDDEYALIIVNGEEQAKLDIAPSGSGARYSNNLYEWHTKANEGLLTKRDQTIKCYAQNLQE